MNKSKEIKQKIREKVWIELEKKGVVKFPGAFGRIPNFVGAEKSAELLFSLDIWKKAKFIKSNPDSPQRAIRERALKEGKTVYMAVPKLKVINCFIKLEPLKIRNTYFASTIKGAFVLGEKIHPKEIKKVDLIIAGSVACNIDGKRLGKGGGYSDLEYAIGRELGFVKEETPIVTNIHNLQLIEEEIPLLPFDIPVDYIITPQNVIKTKGKLKKPEGIIKEFVDQEKLKKIPILRELI